MAPMSEILFFWISTAAQGTISEQQSNDGLQQTSGEVDTWVQGQHLSHRLITKAPDFLPRVAKCEAQKVSKSAQLI